MGDTDPASATGGQDASADPPDGDQDAPELLFGCPVTLSRGQRVVHVDPARYVEVVASLHEDGYLMCADLTAVDYLTYEPDRGLPPGAWPAGQVPERFEVVVNLLRLSDGERVRIRVQVSGDEPAVPSLSHLYPGVEAMEREVFDLFGIVFTGHPDLTRIVMPEDWVGHPLRKDYASGRIPVQFKGAPSHR